MDRNSQAVIGVFTSPENKNKLMAALAYRINPAMVANAGPTWINNFIWQLGKELDGSDPVTGGLWSNVVQEQVEHYNALFLRQIFAMFVEPSTDWYSLSDGHAATRGSFGAQPCVMLKNWRNNAGRQTTLRDDEAEIGTEYGVAPACGDGPRVNVGDYSALGQNAHYDMFMGQAMIKNLNGHKPYWGDSAYGSMLVDEDAKAFTQRTFRNNEDGVENGIPKYRRWLHMRPVERNIGETFAGRDLGFMQRGHDMSALVQRINIKNQARMAHTSRAQQMPIRGLMDPSRGGTYYP